MDVVLVQQQQQQGSTARVTTQALLWSSLRGAEEPMPHLVLWHNVALAHGPLGRARAVGKGNHALADQMV